jgi:hypothetical protein
MIGVIMTESQRIEQAARIIDPFAWLDPITNVRQTARLASLNKAKVIVQQAVAAERERCAVIAETWVIDWARPSGHMPDDIAAAIRQMKDVNDG